ncbi:hypothetical protein [Komagataeibacter xylinus]|uniref:hypothetical protein n=1 Tax=Komagataeibacter xylinus TaxID=28448 RepID=UPI00280AD85B|nr:hypothetical protein [Komagataeibacter xylinus]
MILDDLLAEGESLRRSCFTLSVEGRGDIAGYWRGERPDYTPPALRRHIMTLDSQLLVQTGMPMGYASIGFSEVEDERFYNVLRSQQPVTALGCTGLPLYATPDTSFPPLAAVCLYGSEKVAAWLKTLGLQRYEYTRAALAPLGRAYDDIYTERGDLFRDNVDAIVGGWHQSWPEDDFYMPLEMRRAVLTLREAEPWYELWQVAGGPNFNVCERIT